MQQKAHKFYDDDDIEFLVCQVGNLWRRLISFNIKKLGISITEKRILVCASNHPGLTQIQIATHLDLEPQNLMRSLDKLEKNKLIKKELDPNDRRIKCLYITANAKKILAKIKEISEEFKPNLLQDIDEKNLKLLFKNLKLIRDRLISQLELSDREI
jgi:MarR family transcriptional regulator for hemolysin